MNEPRLVAGDALAGRRIALSVSDSVDLSRLGLLREHCRVAVAEIARAVFMAGGQVVYGGNLDPAGFTTVLLEEALDYADARAALVLVLPHTVHSEADDGFLRAWQDRLGVTGRLVLLDPDGDETDLRRRSRAKTDPAAALASMRGTVTTMTDARVLVGGRLRGYSGRAPGVAEEALLSLQARQPLYVAGGFGGAASAVSQWLGDARPSAWPADLPEGMDDPGVADISRDIAQESATRVPTELDGNEAALLAVTHRAGDIASLVAVGAARALSAG